MRHNLQTVFARFLFVGAILLSVPAAAAVTKSETAVGKSGQDMEARERVLEDAKAGPKQDLTWFNDSVHVEGVERTETAIRRLSDLVRDTPTDNPKRAEYMFRLAELYTGRTSYYEQQAFKRRDQAFLVEDENPQRAEAYRRAADGDLQQSKQYAKKAAELYGDLYQTYRDSFDKMDAVLYFLGSNFLQYDRPEAATQIYEELARSYPTSAYLPQSMLMLGEIAFADGELDRALNYYNVVLQSPENPAYPYAMYKKAWVMYNQSHTTKDYKKALDALYASVQASRAAEEKGSQKLSLTKQASMDLPTFYSEVNTGKVAPAFFDKITPDMSETLLERLAFIYGDQAKYEDANTVLRELIARNPDSFKIVRWQAEIVRNTQPSSTDTDTVREMRRLVKLYNTALTFEDVTPSLKKETSETIEGMLRLYATTFHSQAQTTHNDHYYALALNLYEDYVASFPDGVDAYTMWYYYAELLYRNEEWEKAAHAYEKALSFSSGDGEFDDEARYASCLSYTKMVDLQPSTLGSNNEAMVEDEGELPEVPAEQPLPEEYSEMLNSCDRYLAGTTDPELAAELDYVLAYIYYEYNHFDEAVKRFGEFALTRDDVDHERAVAAADIVLDSLALQRKWAEMRDWIVQLRKSRVYKGEFAERIDTMSEQVSFRACRDAQQKKEFEEAAYCFYQFVNDNPGSQYVDKAIFNAAVSFREIDNLDYSISLLEQLPQLAPNSPLVPDTLYELGRTFHRLAIYDTAADNYEAYVAAAPDGEHAINALANAAQFREGLGQYAKAIDDLNRFMRLSRKDKDQDKAAEAEAAYEIARARDLRGDGPSAIKEYATFVRKYGKNLKSRAVEAIARQGDMYMDRKDEKNGYKLYEDTVSYVSKLSGEERAELSSGAMEAVSRAAFRLADRIFKEFDAVSLDLKTEKGIREATEKKIKLGIEAQKAYDEVIHSYGRPGWQIAALTRLGEMRHVFFEQLIDAPVPAGLSAMVEEEYRTEMENQALNIKEEAMDFYSSAIDAARKSGWFNEYSALAARRLADIDPSFASGSELRIEPGFDSAQPYMSGYAGASDRRQEIRSGGQKSATVPDDDSSLGTNKKEAPSTDDANKSGEGAK